MAHLGNGSLLRGRALPVLVLSFAMAFAAASVRASDGPTVLAAEGDPSAKEAAFLFRDICVATLPNFRKAPAALKRAKFNRNTTTGTYYHPTLNLSVSLEKQNGLPRCSFVMISTADPEQTSLFFSALLVQNWTEAERELTEAQIEAPGQITVRQPGMVDFYFRTKPYKGRSNVLHAALQPDK